MNPIMDEADPARRGKPCSAAVEADGSDIARLKAKAPTGSITVRNRGSASESSRIIARPDSTMQLRLKGNNASASIRFSNRDVTMAPVMKEPDWIIMPKPNCVGVSPTCSISTKGRMVASV